MNNSIRLLIGGVDQSQQPHQHYQGLLADVRLWNTARTLAEITQYMNVKLRGDEDYLVGYWPMDDGLIPDFSPTRTPTHISSSSTYRLLNSSYPPISGRSDEMVTYMFAGHYSTGTNRTLFNRD